MPRATLRKVSAEISDKMAETYRKLASDELRERMRKLAAKGGKSRSAAKVAAVKLNLERANAARKALKG